jgi:glycosyltransferase involved in cell wall biosynthesis
MKLLGIILCYNDADILSDSIEIMLAQNHDLVIWDHGSTDETPTVINQYKNHLLEYQTIPRSFDFYKLSVVSG